MGSAPHMSSYFVAELSQEFSLIAAGHKFPSLQKTSLYSIANVMPPVTKIRQKGFEYHHQYVSISRNDILRDIANYINSRLISLHQTEPDVAFIQANNSELPVKPSGTVYQMCIPPTKPFDISLFKLTWKTSPIDGVKQYDSVEFSCFMTFKENMWTHVSVDEAKQEFHDFPDQEDVVAMLNVCMTDEQLSQ